MMLQMAEREEGGLFAALGGSGDDDTSEGSSGALSLAESKSLESLKTLNFDLIGEGAMKIMQEMEVDEDTDLDYDNTYGMDGVLPPIPGASPREPFAGNYSVTTMGEGDDSRSLTVTDAPTTQGGIFSRASTTLSQIQRRASMAVVKAMSSSAKLVQQTSGVNAVNRIRRQSVAYVRDAAKSVTAAAMDKITVKAGKHGLYCFCGCRNLDAEHNKTFDD
jgi:hypothetical protein